MRQEALWTTCEDEGDTVETFVPEELYDPDTIEVDEYATDEVGVPKVNLAYPNDYDLVRNLPAKRMRRASRKRVTGWARRALCCVGCFG